MDEAVGVEDGELVGEVGRPRRTAAAVSAVFPEKLRPGKMIARPSCPTAPAWMNVRSGDWYATTPRIWPSRTTSECSSVWLFADAGRLSVDEVRAVPLLEDAKASRVTFGAQGRHPGGSSCSARARSAAELAQTFSSTP